MNQSERSFILPLGVITTLFFVWGFITVLNDILIPHFKNVFDLGYAESQLVQLCFFGAYFIMSFPSSIILDKIGYQKGIVVGLVVSSLGAFLFYPAALLLSYPFFLVAFFVLASGITMLQVSANPYVTKLGKPQYASSRLSLAQGFNSLGTTLAPFLGTLFILGSVTYYPFYPHGKSERIPVTQSFKQQCQSDLAAYIKTQDAYREIPKITQVALDRDSGTWMVTSQGIYHRKKYWSYLPGGATEIPADAIGIVAGPNDAQHEAFFTSPADYEAFRMEEGDAVRLPYIGIGSFLFFLALLFMKIKLPEIATVKKENKKGSILKFPHLVSGAVAIFMYVGAEVAIGSFLLFFFELDEIGGLTEKEGGIYIAFYWGAAMVGRFIGAGIQRSISPPKVLTFSALAVVVLILMTLFLSGSVAMWSIILVGLFNSIMFPTIFSLSIKDLGEFTGRGSGLLVMMIAGGAVIPVLLGLLADAVGVQYAFSIVLICYAYVAYFGIKGHRLQPNRIP